ncbi:hypothetical protein GCM10007981_18160 [Thermocladium modestius]|uniref:Uncharacterized protein n=1 Tax=Thermocladium modestius TaxID=62609 RepID=A0A830GXJ5_9CREN|nr:hypothetical protein [Thermocladium modestius]GGP22370.1 hypothetical protein GCM10007981_18160 [Thermocladium modestius]
MPIKYAVPPYRYAAPLKRSLTDSGIEVLTALPPDAHALISNGIITAGLVPIFMLIDGKLQPAPGPMVYSEAETMSVLVVSRNPVPLRECGSIAASPESRSAVAYLGIVMDRAGIKSRIITGFSANAGLLLSVYRCALVLGDEALKARTSFHVVADVGELVRDVLGINPVYAATGARDASIDLSHIRPIPIDEDAAETSRITGISLDEAKRYHESIKLGYDEAKLSTALRTLAELLNESPK